MRNLPLFAVLASLLAAGPALGQGGSSEDVEILESEGTEIPPPHDEGSSVSTYNGIGFSFVSADFSNVEDAVTLDFTLVGFRFPEVSWLAIELNGGITVVQGEITQTQPGSPGGEDCLDPLGLFCSETPGSPETTASGEFGANHVGIYGAVRTPGKFYLTGKLGYRYVDTNLPELQDDKSGTAYTAGLGYRFGRYGHVDFHYTKLTDKLEMLGLVISTSLGYR